MNTFNRISVVGLGYIGLPTAAVFANQGVEVIGVDVKADVAIVGMGISAAMMADSLTDAGLSVVLIDRRGPLLGSTAATTALVQFEIDQPLTTLTKKIGKDNVDAFEAELKARIGG